LHIIKEEYCLKKEGDKAYLFCDECGACYTKLISFMTDEPPQVFHVCKNCIRKATRMLREGFTGKDNKALEKELAKTSAKKMHSCDGRRLRWMISGLECSHFEVEERLEKKSKVKKQEPMTLQNRFNKFKSPRKNPRSKRLRLDEKQQTAGVLTEYLQRADGTLEENWKLVIYKTSAVPLTVDGCPGGCGTVPQGSGYEQETREEQ